MVTLRSEPRNQDDSRGIPLASVLQFIGDYRDYRLCLELLRKYTEDASSIFCQHDAPQRAEVDAVVQLHEPSNCDHRKHEIHPCRLAS